jgi:hypothetical protein
MTPEERKRMEDWIRANCGPHQYGEQDENGVDLSLIRENLKLTPTERLRKLDRARRLARYGIWPTAPRKVRSKWRWNCWLSMGSSLL